MSTQLILVLSGAVGTLACAVWALIVTAKLKGAEAARDTFKTAFESAQRATAKANATIEDDAARFKRDREMLIAEIEKRERIINASSDPAVLRARLDSLLSQPASPPAKPAASVPRSPATSSAPDSG